MKWIKRFVYTFLILFVLLNVVSAFHAYKLTHFYNRNAKVKKPEQMSGWEKTEAILLGVDYPKKKIEEFPSMAFQKYTVQTEDGLHLKGWRMADGSIKNAKGAVIMFHGHAANKAAVLREANAFKQLGYCVYLVDFRAHGESDGNICTIGFDESKDVKATYEYVKKDIGNKRIILWGISLGAATISKAMADYNAIKPSKVILEMPFGSLNEAVEGRLRTMHLPEQPFAALLTFWGGTEHGFWAFAHNPSEYVKKISCPVLVQWGVNDARVTEKETYDILNNLASHNKRLVRYNTAGHESLYKKEPLKWMQNVAAFLAE
jgi:alpha-beta hydrolase superfamily lysophospholipase